MKDHGMKWIVDRRPVSKRRAGVLTFAARLAN
ncbi:MAG: hypothetical protein JWR46_1819 [Mycobacterium sp.]|nr:hypothetical protein [Mycobacterium sp.]